MPVIISCGRCGNRLNSTPTYPFNSLPNVSSVLANINNTCPNCGCHLTAHGELEIYPVNSPEAQELMRKQS